VPRERRKARRSRLTYAKLLNRVIGLAKEGERIVSPGTSIRGSTVNEWLRRVLEALSLLESDIPSALERFRKLKFHRPVHEEDEEETSDSAYRNDADHLIDFDFDNLRQAVRALELARQAIELKLAHSRKQRTQRAKAIPRKAHQAVKTTDRLIVDAEWEKLLPSLAGAILRRHLSQEEAAERIGTHRTDLNKWLNRKQVPRPGSRQKISKFIEELSRPAPS
jgi:ElaB/YqjD/DUF883 family membrane-anchored ribosome-binding protein